MAVKLVIKGLRDVREEELYDLFDVYGFIEAVCLDCEVGGDCADTGYIIFADSLAGLEARVAMDGAEINGSRIVVYDTDELTPACRAEHPLPPKTSHALSR